MRLYGIAYCVKENSGYHKRSDTNEFARYFRFMLDRGFYLAPSQFEAMFVSLAHTDELIDDTLAAIEAFFA